MAVTIISDVVSSRNAPDRNALQREIESAALAVEKAHPRAAQPWWPTAGDEFQAVYDTIEDALVATLYLQLALPEGIACRFGIGVGDITPVESSLADAIQDGPGWWAAREAVQRAEERDRGRFPGGRSWLTVHETASAELRAQEGIVNAYLLLRDQVVADMNARARRAVFDSWLGLQQKEIAEKEGVTQAAVSQAINKPLVRALRLGAKDLGLPTG
ncbi:SatD family protein [Microbacterium marinilacus]|uniref:SatD family protein n=1 Tax=Microbacterium marinilacus TaxID=415209 RepID=A0ABP7B374_9MICO|nr:SatD family protein [Microbacterium marinilacus]MBY0687919.1 SatD family protein [Microbacterium marinilacus]